MNIIGSSSVLQLGVLAIGTGPTGPTGPIGNTGPAGAGITGATGISIVGITSINRYIITTFSDGSTYGTPSQAYGTTGNVNYLIDYFNIGTGVSLAHSIENQTDLVLRPIRFVNTTSAPITINTTSTDITVSLETSIASGITLNAAQNDKNYLLNFNNKKLRRVSDAIGITSSDGNYTGLAFVNANIFERVRGMGWTGSTGAVNCQQTAAGITCTINPFVAEYDALMYGAKSRVFVGDFGGNTGSIYLAPCPNDGNAYGVELHLFNCINPADLQNRFISQPAISWPFNKPPCFSIEGTTCDIRASFFGVNGRWYATAKSTNENCRGATLFYDNCLFPVSLMGGYRSFMVDITGACCKEDGTCTQTSASYCNGYFHGFGTTCGNTYDSICNKPGACCFDGKYQDTTTGDTSLQNYETLRFCTELTCTDCLKFGGKDTQYVTRFSGNGTKCNEINCGSVILDNGACCDGKGNCYNTTKEECENISGFFQGKNTTCSAFGSSICLAGTGPCCINGTCTSQSATDCFNANGYFLGFGRDCGEFTCPDNISCLGYVNGVKIYPGQKYGGGYVVGTFEPGTTKILGAKNLFSPVGSLSLNGVTTYASEYYTSFLDHTAYGITKADCNFYNESYIIVVYPEDVYETQETYNTFAWGGTGSSWGPILDNGGNYNDFRLNKDSGSPVLYCNTHLKYNEGYWGITGATGLNSDLIIKTFPTCEASTTYGIRGDERIFAKSPYSIHGLWHHSWGLYNTIRAISANNTYKQKTSLSGVYDWKDFTGITTTNAFLAARKIADGLTSDTQSNTPNTSAISGWYLPSHDEMAFIAANTKTLGFNINTHLLLNDEQAINGTYWTSTGTFDYSSTEGVYNNSKPTPGSKAIAMKIDINQQDYKVYKENRQEKHKVRPIRMIRCDSQLPANRYLWLIPAVYRSINVNTRNIDNISIGAFYA